jgi:hypothetical protein
VQVHEEHDDLMMTRMTGAIATEPTGNAQGGFWFYSLTTGRMLDRKRWTSLPMPQDAIDRIAVLARRDPIGMKWTNMRNEAACDVDDDADSDDGSDNDNDSDHDSDNDDEDDDNYDDFIAGVDMPNVNPPDPPDEHENGDENQQNENDDDDEENENDDEENENDDDEDGEFPMTTTAPKNMKKPRPKRLSCLRHSRSWPTQLEHCLQFLNPELDKRCKV